MYNKRNNFLRGDTSSISNSSKTINKLFDKRLRCEFYNRYDLVNRA